MVTVKADNKRRVVIPDIKPGQVLALDKIGEGSFTLTIVKPDRKEPFPEGSLKKYWTARKDREELDILKDCIQGPPSDE